MIQISHGEFCIFCYYRGTGNNKGIRGIAYIPVRGDDLLCGPVQVNNGVNKAVADRGTAKGLIQFDPVIVRKGTLYTQQKE